ncbi:Fic family protein [Desulfoluna sp.]|uniref:Fic family protein n=1 Tax=Desulfoluna sp. TaxID=2045199 RepID=UPI00262EEDC5|nr:Fic family protein [Desulfoluna sp.]
MKKPEMPPETNKLFVDVIEKHSPIFVVEKLTLIEPMDSKGRYLHWAELRHKPAPFGLTNEEWWLGTKLARQFISENLPFKNITNEYFTYCIPKPLYLLIEELQSKIDELKETSSSMRKQYLASCLREEAISSSQLEGASTTRLIAKQMLLEERAPVDKSEQMIFNNYHALELLKELKDEQLTPQTICHIHFLLVENTLDEDKTGAYRTENDNVIIMDHLQSGVLHNPPPAKELQARIKSICDFANDNETKIHPIIKAIIIHFMLAYDHPFVDGNGRTARALFYWVLINHNYHVMEFFSISKILKEKRTAYGKAFLFTETDSNDMTYFISHQLDILKQSVQAFEEYIERKKDAREEALISGSISNISDKLNVRQLELLIHALEHYRFTYSIPAHAKAHGITTETARKDLLQLSDKYNLLKKFKDGRSYVFMSPPDLVERLSKT